MDHCSFCQDDQPEQLFSLCPCKEGIAICRQCLIDGKFADAVQCNVCRVRHGRRLRNMRAELEGKTQALRFSFGSKPANQDEVPSSASGSFQQMPQPGQMYNMQILSSKKKSSNVKPTTENPQNFPMQGYPNFGGQNMQNMQNFQMPPHYMQQQYGHQQFNPNMLPPYWHPQFYNYPPMMMQQQPNYNWYSQPPPNYGQNSSYQAPKLENKFEYDVYNGLSLHAERVITPVKREEEDEEELRIGKHWNGVFPSRNQNKTTDYLQDSTTRIKSTRINRSNSVNSLTLRR